MRKFGAKNISMMTAISVSYTHLDVYKRQIQKDFPYRFDVFDPQYDDLAKELERDNYCLLYTSLYEQCSNLPADVRSCLENGYFTVTVPPPWNMSNQKTAQEVQDKIKEWSRQYTGCLLYTSRCV